MKQYLPIALLTLTLAGALSLAADPPKQSPTNAVRQNRTQDRTQQSTSPAQPPIQPAAYISQPQPQDLQKSVNELRKEVESLQRDIKGWRCFLEFKEGSSDEWQPLNASPAEQKIWKALKKGIALKIEKLPLSDVMRTLSKQIGINIVLDSRGLEEVGLNSQTPITDFEVEGIRLKSVLVLMLEPLDLGFTVREEAIVITSRTRAQGKRVVVSYPVADLAIPIPLAGPVPNDEKIPSAISPAIDFDSLIDIIQASVQPLSWETVGGSGSIRAHESTLSLVIRQSSQAHREIEDLLNQLRRLQDTQVSVESRFLFNLPEDIWKQLGIDFDSRKNVVKKNTKDQQRDNGPLGGIILTDQQVALLLEAAQNNERSNLIQAPKVTKKVTLWNGQTAGVTDYRVVGKQNPLKHSIYVQPVISADRREVRLNLRVSDLNSPEMETRTYVNTVPDGKTILIELVQRETNKTGIPITQKSSNAASRIFKNTNVPQARQFLLLRPRIIVQEEEEEPVSGFPN
ncbi:hypothetical protein Pan241w_34860 [Gimesia alba]|uniref:NolW-like domain-containing protein n=1 Tax=Gimesia alba TaxID=2527973 RepID=A0A517RHN1_9PLAN|nr:hypothetical protein [Gimesia alba]QDT43386.1 hypothetical protein Pan241w_34860 [Gimesia alba]